MQIRKPDPINYGTEDGHVQLNVNQDVTASRFIEMLQKFPVPTMSIIWGCYLGDVGKSYAKQSGVPTWTAFGKAYSNLTGEGGIIPW